MSESNGFLCEGKLSNDIHTYVTILLYFDVATELWQLIYTPLHQYDHCCTSSLSLSLSLDTYLEIL